jgi:DNA replication and repair protein RecF
VASGADGASPPAAPGEERAPSQAETPAALQLSKTIKVNGLPTRASQLVGQINVVFFSPEDLNLVTGPPAGRRRYLDITNSQVNHLYLRALQRFNRVVTQRNHLLRQVRERRQPRELLDFWTEELARAGTYVVRHRLEMVEAVNGTIGDIYRQLVGAEHDLRLEYEATAAVKDGEHLRLSYRERLAELQGKEIEAGVTLIGPHRDDFTFVVDGVDVGVYGSRGQQRLAVLALRLAEADYMRAQTDEEPILLLDDVLSELDVARRKFVLARVARGGQSLITTADLSAFDPEFLAQAALFHVQRGSVTAERPALRTER